MEKHVLYPGIELLFFDVKGETLPYHHEALDTIMEINYCKSGRIGWSIGNGNNVYLGPGDFSLHTMKTCAACNITLPNGSYEGLTILVDLKRLDQNPPELLSGTGITGEFLYGKFCDRGYSLSLSGNEETECIFRPFFEEMSELKTVYWKIKAVELLLFLSKLEVKEKEQISVYQSEQIDIIRKIHEQMVHNMNQRFTIEYLSKEYLMNPTTLKQVFKAVYGTSIAAHVKGHRMEEAARLLVATDDSIAEIADQVGYTSQSKFTTAFKEYFGELPTEYRRRNNGH